MERIVWTEGSLEELLNMNIGEIREMLAYEDSDSSFRTFLIEGGWIEDTDNEYDDNDDYEDNDYDDDDYEDEEDDNYDEDEDDDLGDDEEEDSTPSVSSSGMASLSGEKESLAQSIANDIDNGAYTLDTIRPIYDSEIVNRVEYLID